MHEQIRTENGRCFARGDIVRSFAQIEAVGRRYGFDHTSLHKTDGGEWLLQGFTYPSTGRATWRLVAADEAADWLDANGYAADLDAEAACSRDGEPEVSLLAEASLRTSEASSPHLR